MNQTRQRILGTAGHIDHGKTALVRALTGVDTDRLPDEKRRGITIDLGFASLNLGEDLRIGLIDVPGHERFIHNMLAGATGLDLALLIVAADDSVMPQTREHLELLKLLGIPAGLVAITKCDLVDPAWLALVEEDIRKLVEGSFLEGSPIVRTSAQTGAGVAELRAALAEIAASTPIREDPGAFRMAIDRVFSLAGQGTIVTGTIASGVVRVGDELELWPEGRTVRVRGMHQHDQVVESLGRGCRAAINLAGVRHDEVARGDQLAMTGYLRPSHVLGVTLERSTDAPVSLKNGGRYRLHLGTADLPARLVLFEPTPPAAGENLTAQLVLGRPAAAVYGQPFVLRQESPAVTLGGGRVIRPGGRRIRRRDAAARSNLDRLRSLDPITRARAAYALAGTERVTPLDLTRETGIALGESTAVLETLERSGEIITLTAARREVRLASETVREMEHRCLRALERLHSAHPRQATIGRARLAAAMPDLDTAGLAHAVIDRLIQRGEIVAEARAVALRTFQPRLSQSERRLKDEIDEAYRKSSFSPPELSELVAQAGSRGDAVRDLVGLLVAEGRLVEITPQLLLDADAESELRRRVLDRLADGSGLTMADMRDMLGTTRKYAVPFGEYLDRIGLTRREGDVRRAAADGPVTPPADS